METWRVDYTTEGFERPREVIITREQVEALNTKALDEISQGRRRSAVWGSLYLEPKPVREE